VGLKGGASELLWISMVLLNMLGRVNTRILGIILQLEAR